MIPDMKAKVIFIGKNQKEIVFLKEKKSKWPTKKGSFSSSANSQNGRALKNP